MDNEMVFKKIFEIKPGGKKKGKTWIEVGGRYLISTPTNAHT